MCICVCILAFSTDKQQVTHKKSTQQQQWGFCVCWSCFWPYSTQHMHNTRLWMPYTRFSMECDKGTHKCVCRFCTNLRVCSLRHPQIWLRFECVLFLFVCLFVSWCLLCCGCFALCFLFGFGCCVVWLLCSSLLCLLLCADTNTRCLAQCGHKLSTSEHVRWANNKPTNTDRQHTRERVDQLRVLSFRCVLACGRGRVSVVFWFEHKCVENISYCWHTTHMNTHVDFVRLWFIVFDFEMCGVVWAQEHVFSPRFPFQQ